MLSSQRIAAEPQVLRSVVLRNTYWLLALTMIPTVLGAFLGVATGIPMPTGLVGFVLMLAVLFGFIWGIEKNKNSGLGVALLLGFTFIMGLFLTPILTRTLGFSNGASLIMTAFGGTAAVFLGMASIGTMTKRDFSGAGKFLTISMLVIIAAFVANIFLQMPLLTLILSTVVIALMSFWIVYDVQRIVNGGETNYISATLSLYLSIFNIFTSLLQILGIVGGDD